MFVVTMILSKMVTWTRRQSGTGELRALIYMDEVFGYVPPTAAPPAKKPILTILKQARAHGVGMVLSTQNPVDVDYKALSNAGTWMIGRLQTERDKARLLDGMTSAAGEVDRGAIDDTISALDKREFLFHSTRADTPERFSTRWAMSYLAGPLTRDQIGRSPLTSRSHRRHRARRGGARGRAVGSRPPTSPSWPRTRPRGPRGRRRRGRLLPRCGRALGRGGRCRAWRHPPGTGAGHARADALRRHQGRPARVRGVGGVRAHQHP